MKNDTVWDIFVSSMWCNQWTRQPVLLTDVFKNALYAESQGIIDIAVKLYAMVQLRAIALGKEIFSPSDFHSVAAERLGLVKPMLDALRSGDKKKIDMYGDIAPVNMEDYYSAYSTVLEQNKNIPQKRNEISISEKAVLKLLELGVEPPKAKYLTGKVMAEHKEARDAADVVRLAYRIYLSAPEPNAGDGFEQGDLRVASGYADLRMGGVIEVEEW